MLLLGFYILCLMSASCLLLIASKGGWIGGRVGGRRPATFSALVTTEGIYFMGLLVSHWELTGNVFCQRGSH